MTAKASCFCLSDWQQQGTLHSQPLHCGFLPHLWKTLGLGEGRPNMLLTVPGAAFHKSCSWFVLYVL